VNIFVNILLEAIQPQTKEGGISMKRVVKGKVVDAARMEKLASVEYGSIMDYGYCWETLYWNPDTKEFYLHGKGGAASRYREAVGMNQWAEGEALMRYSKEKVLDWLERNQIDVTERIEQLLEEAE